MVFHHKFITWLQANNYNVEEIVNLPEAELQKLLKKAHITKPPPTMLTGCRKSECREEFRSGSIIQ